MGKQLFHRARLVSWPIFKSYFRIGCQKFVNLALANFQSLKKNYLNLLVLTLDQTLNKNFKEKKEKKSEEI